METKQVDLNAMTTDEKLRFIIDQQKQLIQLVSMINQVQQNITNAEMALGKDDADKIQTTK